MLLRLLPYALLAALVGAAYFNAVGNALVWDDRIYVLENPPVRDARWGEILARPTGSYYRPLVFLTLAIDHARGGESGKPYQLTNIALHTIVSGLLLSALLLLGASRPVAISAALVFALHPVQTEAVTYISGRTDLLAALFSLLALHLHARAHGWRGAPGGAAFSCGVLVCFALALASKESALALPFALLAGDRVFARSSGRSLRRDLLAVVPALVLLLAWVLLRARLGGFRVTVGAAANLPMRLSAGLAALESYGRLLLFPVNLHLERFVDAASGPALVGALLLAIATLAFRKGDPATRFGILWAALAYLPVSNLVPVYPGLPTGRVFAPEHFLYLPLTGILIAAARLRPARCPRPPALAALGAILLCFGFLVHDRNRDWRDEETLYIRTLRFSPDSARVRLNLGNLYLARADLEHAAETFAEGSRRNPRDADLAMNLGVAEMRLGRIAEAEAALLRAVDLRPEDARAWANLGAAYGTAGWAAQARGAYKRALALDPSNVNARQGLRYLNSVQGKSE